MKMNIVGLIAIVAAGGLLANSPALRAGDDKEVKPEVKPGVRQEQRREVMKEHRDKMFEELKLTDQQKEQIKEANKAQGEKMRGLPDLPPKERQEKVKALHEEMDKKMKGILTAEQYEKWHKTREQERTKWQERAREHKRSGEEKK